MSNLKVKTILVSQPEPKVENSPYFDLQNKLKVKVDFRPFIHVEGVPAKEVRAQKIDLNNYTAIILTRLIRFHGLRLQNTFVSSILILL